jgi:hypothetical protein
MIVAYVRHLHKVSILDDAFMRQYLLKYVCDDICIVCSQSDAITRIHDTMNDHAGCHQPLLDILRASGKPIKNAKRVKTDTTITTTTMVNAETQWNRVHGLPFCVAHAKADVENSGVFFYVVSELIRGLSEITTDIPPEFIRYPLCAGIPNVFIDWGEYLLDTKHYWNTVSIMVNRRMISNSITPAQLLQTPVTMADSAMYEQANGSYSQFNPFLTHAPPFAHDM